ncbi:MAG: radical SAM family RiPP maturation amino acid epimerase, partial [Pseudomonadota bacterium]
MNHVAPVKASAPVSTISIGQTKRVLEWWSSSQKFRDMIKESPAKAGEAFDLGFDPTPLRPLWDAQFGVDMHNRGEPFHPAVLEYRAFYNSKTEWRDDIKAECSPGEIRFKTWRDRQLARNMFENGAYDDYIIHTPLAIELTDGCTVGCWFCGVGATKFVDALDYEANKEDWRKTLQYLHDKTGNAGRWGFCYWATDPLDVPEYEKFATDFADVFGLFPQTTTAQAHKHLDRLRDLLPLSEGLGCRVNRFSVLTERNLREIYDYFTPDEMVNVEIVSQMKEATIAKADAGDFRILAMERDNVKEREQEKLAVTAKKMTEGTETAQEVTLVQPGTIACVSGFLLNMMKNTVKLISPCRASHTWPLGYIVYDEASFDGPDDLNRVLDRMIETHMTTEVSEDMRMRFHPMLDYYEEDDGFVLSSVLHAVAIRRPEYGGYVRMLGQMIKAGDKTAGQIALTGLYQFGIPEANTMATLNTIFASGALVDAHGRIAG